MSIYLTTGEFHVFVIWNSFPMQFLYVAFATFSKWLLSAYITVDQGDFVSRVFQIFFPCL